MGSERACPFCAEPIHPDAIKCKHCGEMLAAAPTRSALPDPSRDEEHLRMLTIGHFVAAAVTFLFSCMPLLHVGMGILMLTNPEGLFGKDHPPRAFGWVVIAFGSLFILLGWTLALVMFIAGRSIAARKRYTFCQIVAGASCLFMPFGTILGIFSFIVLLRPQVKALFDARASGRA